MVNNFFVVFYNMGKIKEFFENSFTAIIITLIAFVLVVSSVSFISELNSISQSNYLIFIGNHKYYTYDYKIIEDNIFFVDVVTNRNVIAFYDTGVIIEVRS